MKFNLARIILLIKNQTETQRLNQNQSDNQTIINLSDKT